MKKTYLFIFLLLLVALGCTTTMHYSFDKGEYYECCNSYPSSITVLTFEDIRKQPKLDSQNCIKEDSKYYRYNANSRYAKKGIKENLGNMIALHLKASGMFNNAVYASKSNSTDLVMTGTIKRFEGFRELIKTDRTGGPGATGALGGVIYFAIHSKDKIEVRGAVELVDIQIKTVKDDKIIWQGDVKKESKEIVNWGDNINEFNYPEKLLRTAVDEMVKNIEVDLNK